MGHINFIPWFFNSSFEELKRLNPKITCRVDNKLQQASATQCLKCTFNSQLINNLQTQRFI